MDLAAEWGELLHAEALGIAERGKAHTELAAGAFDRDGRVAVSPSGGLLSRGHPVGAPGVAQICELVQQIRGEAGDRQSQRHSLGLAENLGGSGATCVVSILGAA